MVIEVRIKAMEWTEIFVLEMDEYKRRLLEHIEGSLYT